MEEYGTGKPAEKPYFTCRGEISIFVDFDPETTVKYAEVLFYFDLVSFQLLGGWLGNQNEVGMSGTGKPAEKPDFCCRGEISIFAEIAQNYTRNQLQQTFKPRCGLLLT